MNLFIRKTLGSFEVARVLGVLTSRACAGIGVLLLLVVLFACGQTPPGKSGDDLTDLSQAIPFIKANGDKAFIDAFYQKHGVTPYDHGNDLLIAGKAAAAKRWYEEVAVATEKPIYLYGAATTRWKMGDNHGALKDCRFLLGQKPSLLLKARTLYTLGTILIDERDFEAAKEILKTCFETYGMIPKKFGGQYLALSMLAWAAVVEGNYDEVKPLLDRALEFNEKLRTIGIEPYGLGRYHETLAELRFVQRDYQGALAKAEESEQAYKNAKRPFEADMMRSKVGLYNLLSGRPKVADEIASALWAKFNNRPDRTRAAAYNEVTLAKLDQCADNEGDRKKREQAARKWANRSAGGKALIQLLEFIMDKGNVPCPEWR